MIREIAPNRIECDYTINWEPFKYSFNEIIRLTEDSLDLDDCVKIGLVKLYRIKYYPSMHLFPDAVVLEIRYNRTIRVVPMKYADTISATVQKYAFKE